MNPEQIERLLGQLQTASFEELRTEYASDWAVVEKELTGLFERGKPEELKTYIVGLLDAGAQMARTLGVQKGGKKGAENALAKLVRGRLAFLAIRKVCLVAAAGGEKASSRFSLINGLLIQKLMFAEGLVRKPVSMFWFKWIWPIIGQKELLLPLVHPKGIYCFFSDVLVEKIAEIIGSKPALEIGAGDGTLSRFLNAKGAAIRATDNHSWNHSITFPPEVINLDAREALASYSPEVVICSWPPAANSFERHVFKTRSVQTYVVIGSRHRFAAGNWSDYDQQSEFTFELSSELSPLVLPPELEAAVYLFRRKQDRVS